MKWHPTQWRKPRTKRKLRVRFRNGKVSTTAMEADKWDWADRDFDWDIVEVRIEE